MSVEIFARGDSLDYRFFVDADGVFNDGLTAPRTNPSDILGYICERTWPGLYRDLTISDPSWTDALTWLAGIAPNIIPLEYGSTLETQLAGIGYQCRSQIVTAEREPQFVGDVGLRYRILASQAPTLVNSANYTFPAPALTIDQYDEIAFESRDADSIFTGFRAFYRPERALRVGDKGFAEVYEHLYFSGAPRSDFDNAPADLAQIRADYGDWNAPIMEFLGIGAPLDATDYSIADVFGYYIQELARNAKVWIVRRVPWVQQAALELGDIVSLDVPWESSLQKCRILEIDRSFVDGFADLRMVGVL